MPTGLQRGQGTHAKEQSRLYPSQRTKKIARNIQHGLKTTSTHERTAVYLGGYHISTVVAVALPIHLMLLLLLLLLLEATMRAQQGSSGTTV